MPVLVKTSYFPNWQVNGAKAVYRVTPNLMVVVPTAYHVTLTYGYTPVDWTGFILSLFGLLGLVALWRLGPVAYAAPRQAAGPFRFGWGGGPGHGATDKVRSGMTALDPEAVGSVFKAYDIRGTVPDQINPDLARSPWVPPSPLRRVAEAARRHGTCGPRGWIWWRRSPKAPPPPAST